MKLSSVRLVRSGTLCEGVRQNICSISLVYTRFYDHLKHLQNALICIFKCHFFCIFCLQLLVMAFISQNVQYHIHHGQINSWITPSVCACSCPDVKERTTRSFSVDGVSNYTSLHLSKEDNMLYLGAREILFALNLTDISAVKLQRNVRAKHL